jgi:glycosyltransferase involved in cell wall biosynthesis
MALSVLMSVYAREKPRYLFEALNSLARQQTQADEVVLVEDGPIPQELTDIIEAFRSSLNIRSVRLHKNLGLGAALNQGLKHCKHDLVARMDSDDISLPQRFAEQLKLFEQDAELDIVGTSAVEIDDAGNHGNFRHVPTSHQEILKNLWACPLIHPSIMFRRKRVMDIGGYAETLERRQDYELWFRCARSGFRFANLPEATLLYRFSSFDLRKQTVHAAWQQGLIGFKGAHTLGMPLWKQLACFFPFLRSLCPSPINAALYRFGRRWRMKAPL